MDLKLVFTILVFTSPILAHSQAPAIFDITKYGATANADIAKIVTDIWTEAIASTTPTKIVIPGGTWILSQLILEGPNKAPLELEVQGTLTAYTNPTNMPQKDREWVTINYVSYFTLSGGGVFDGRGQEAWKTNDCHKSEKCAKLPYNLSFNSHNHSIIRDVTTKDSKNFHVNLMSSYNVTFERFRISAPGESPNTDGIHIARGSNINVINSIIETGDDCISMGDELSQVRIRNVTCGPGHGISIGSLGRNPGEKDVSDIEVTNCTFVGTSNGVRVKTWPSAPGTLTISGLVFQDLIMINASNPVIIDQQYCPWNLCSLDSPSLIQVSNVTIKNVKGTSDSPEPILFSCSGKKPCDNVVIGDVDIQFIGKNASNGSTKCANVKPTIIGKQNVPICSAAA